MSSTEVFEYWLQVRDDANPALLKTSAAATSLGGAAYKAGGDLIKLSDVMGKLSTVGPTVANAFNNVSAGAKALQARMAPAAAAISGVGTALGSSGGEMGKFVNAAAQGAAAFGAGGFWGLAIVGATLAIDEYTKVTKESEAALNVWRQQLTTVHPAMLATRETVKGLADEARRLGLEAANAGKTQYEVAIATAAAEKGVLESKLANIEATDRLRQAAVNEAQSLLESARLRGRGVAEAEERLETAKAIQSTVARNAAEYRSQVASIEDSVWKIADAWVTVEGRAKAAAGAGRAAAANSDTEPAIFDDTSFANTDVEIEREKEDAKDRIRDETARREQARQDALEAAAKARAKRILDNEEAFRTQNYEQEKAALERLRATQEEYAKQGFNVAAGAAQGYLDALITGQENAEAMLAASLMRTAGQALISHGVDLGGRATVSLLSGLLPLAAAQGAGAAALVAGGVALGGVATGITHVAAGGKIGQALPTSSGSGAAREPGASPGSLGSGGTRTEAGTSLTIIYGGLSGPTADQGLRTLTRAQALQQGRAGLVSRRQRFR